MTDEVLYDILSDSIVEGVKKNRIRAMQLVEECRYRERMHIGEMYYCKIAPKTWVLKKKFASTEETSVVQDTRPKHISRCPRSKVRILEVCKNDEVDQCFYRMSKAAKELDISHTSLCPYYIGCLSAKK